MEQYPAPNVHSSHRLNREAELWLQKHLGGFLFHPPAEDYGWDFFVEVQITDDCGKIRATSLNFLVQLKATERERKGLISATLNTSTVSMLMGQPMPTLLVLYDKSDQLSYASWLHNIIPGQSHKLNSQDSISVSLQKIKSNLIPSEEEIILELLAFRGIQNGFNLKPRRDRFAEVDALAKEILQSMFAGYLKPSFEEIQIPDSTTYSQRNSRGQDYYLQHRIARYSDGKTTRLIYFTRRPVLSRSLGAVPRNSMVSENARTGLLLLKQKV